MRFQARQNIWFGIVRVDVPVRCIYILKMERERHAMVKNKKAKILYKNKTNGVHIFMLQMVLVLDRRHHRHFQVNKPRTSKKVRGQQR